MTLPQFIEGEDKMTVQEMWKHYSQEEKITAEYDVWAFGDDPDALAALVLSGTKTATASGYPLYQLEGEEIPKAGQYSVILNTREEAVCIIRTERVFIVPFDQVDEKQAWKEGEGDRSLSHWRRLHESFFRRELTEAGLSFDEKMPVVCEEFVRVYP